MCESARHLWTGLSWGIVTFIKMCTIICQHGAWWLFVLVAFNCVFKLQVGFGCECFVCLTKGRGSFDLSYFQSTSNDWGYLLFFFFYFSPANISPQTKFPSVLNYWHAAGKLQNAKTEANQTGIRFMHQIEQKTPRPCLCIKSSLMILMWKPSQHNRLSFHQWNMWFFLL